LLKTFAIPLIRSYAPNAIRHGAQAAAGALVANGYLAADEGQLVGGALLTLLTVVWSVVEKKGLLSKLFV
jgi:hypothetical protein